MIKRYYFYSGKTPIKNNAYQDFSNVYLVKSWLPVNPVKIYEWISKEAIEKHGNCLILSLNRI